MTAAQLPDFELTLATAKGYLDAPELAECHGVACGLLCRVADATLDTYVNLLDMLELAKTPDAVMKSALDKLLNATRVQLADEELGLSLWLPDDDETLEDRTMALSQWCSGFLASLGGGGDERLNALSDDAGEALKDLQQISTADVIDTTESEEEESAFVEIVEYIRIVVMLIREELRGPDQQDLIH